MSAPSLLELCVDPAHWRQCRETLVADSHQLILKASNVLQDRGTTELLALVSGFNTSPYVVIVATMLAIQSEEVPPRCCVSYVTQVKRLLQLVHKDHLPFVQKEVVIVCHKVAEMMCNLQSACVVLPSLMHVCEVLAPTPTCLTAVHADVLQACISSKMYSTAVAFLSSTTILEINPKRATLPSVDCLRFFYYAGICFIAVKNFSEALEYLVECACVPANVLSAVAVQAVRKARLVALIAKGKALVLPSYCSSAVSRHAKIPLSPYDEINAAFETDDAAALFLAVSNAEAALSADLNFGLAKQVYQALFRHRLLQLPAIYSSISLQEVALLCEDQSVESAERQILALVLDGSMSALIDKARELVVFTERSSVADTRQTIQFVRSEIRNTMHLSDRLQSAQRGLITSKKFVSRLVPRSHSQMAAEDAFEISDF